MAEAQSFKLRLLEKKSSTLDGEFRVYFHPDDLKTLRLQNGDRCVLSAGSVAGVGIAWLGDAKSSRAIVKASHSFKEVYGFKLEDRFSVSKDEGNLPRIQSIWAKEVTPGQGVQEGEEEAALKYSIHSTLYHLEAIWTGGVIDVLPKSSRRKRRFTIEKIEPDLPAGLPVRPWTFDTDSILHLSHSTVPDGVENSKGHAMTPIQIDGEGIGALDRQLEELNGHIAAMKRLLDKNGLSSKLWPRRKPARILMHGPQGTGKTLVLNKLKTAGFRNVTTIDSDSVTNRAMAQKAFTDAISQQPSLIVMDDLHLLAGNGDREGKHYALPPIIAKQMGDLGEAQVLVVAATGNPNDIDTKLRPYFNVELELPVPDAIGRRQILRALRGSLTSISDTVIDAVGDKTHGFVGRDLDQLCEAAAHAAELRILREATATDKPNGDFVSRKGIEHGFTDNDHPENPEILLSDFATALQRVRPTAMREITLSTPNVSWSDIGGSETVKAALSKFVDLPFKHPEIMSAFNIRPPRGILLYGPPGCSKTLTAKAVAASSGLNFVAVKGAELTSMYVGETERSVREVFRKARAASPSVIFFDEIDAIASSRGTEGGGKSGGGTPGLNVLTTLLNEMDGIENLDNVLVLAATNRPDILDPALLRPGRFDAVLYVSPPPLEARKQIFAINMSSKIFEDVDPLKLAELTEGHSGAEIASMCNDAAWFAALRAHANFESGDNDGILNERVKMDEFEDLVQNYRKTITREMVEGYERWAAGHGDISKL
ncbi:AAA-domain-containing protein [Rhizodiscina lignyota]|uniref:AAA-domain-containing protein n=1 Tax=Rhizodiscina lignyota TaxID=1504668 RepID=A0A9P4M4L2_9PEZI|nr:AAA-domain-containing protein [Rhizodiscina lignyota]